ncbi:MAG: DNA repair and recombination protein RadB [Methanolinea sp.]|nr:DNA repair and recombination protein RadB [Methanolinea sp.]
MREAARGTGSEVLDALLGGGLSPGILTQVYGEPASGKSTICVMAAVTCLREGGRVIFLDSEGFSAERFRQIAGDDAVALAENIFLFEPEDFSQQAAMIRNFEPLLREGAGLLVVDSLTGLYRSQLERGRDAMQRLTGQALLLLGYARKYAVPVLVSNQVYMDPERNTFVGLGGTALEHLSKVIVRLERRGQFRRATLVKHRSRPAGAYFDFEITRQGIRPLGPLQEAGSGEGV